MESPRRGRPYDSACEGVEGALEGLAPAHAEALHLSSGGSARLEVVAVAALGVALATPAPAAVIVVETIVDTASALECCCATRSSRPIWYLPETGGSAAAVGVLAVRVAAVLLA